MVSSFHQLTLLGMLFVGGSMPGLFAQDGSAKEATQSPTMTAFGDLVELGAELQIQPAGEEPFEFVEQPLMNWSNPTTYGDQSGCVFVWTRHGRPNVIGSIFTYGAGNQLRMKYEFHSLAQQPLKAEYRDRTAWTPSSAGVRWFPFDNSAPPRSNPRLRLTQLRGIARQYTATLEKPDGLRTRLELKPTPLYRYESEQERVLDGAIFSFANGTDPDVLMLVEAVEEDGSQGSWRCAFARFHFWRVFVQDADQSTVWDAEQQLDLGLVSLGDPQAISRPYVSYHVARRPLQP